jgi:transposase
LCVRILQIRARMNAATINKDLLPTDTAALHALVRELLGRLKISDLRADRAEYKLRDLIRRLYGSKNERLNEAQRQLFGILEEQINPEPAQPLMLKTTTKTSSKKKGGGRHTKPENLPIKRRLIDLSEEQKVGLVKIREEITEQIEFRPSQFYRLHLVRPVYAHPKKEHAPILAALPPQVIPKAGVGPGFIAHVLVAKYVDCLPLYRQEGIDARGGVWISRQARCRYVDAAAHLLITIREQLKAKILSSGYVQVDETFTKLLDPERRGRSRDAYLWGYHAPHEQAVVLEFSPSRSGEILYDFFPSPWAGIAQTDGAAMYPRVFRHRPGILHVECWAHLRRYVLEAIKSDGRQAIPLLKDITELYRIERLARVMDLTHDQRGLLRHAKNLVRYAKVGMGHVQIDQNGIERCFRSGKVGLRNYLFVGHPAAGWRSAVIYSVVASCKLVGVNPESYLTWVLPILAAGTNRSTAQGLLPHDFAKLTDTESLTHCAPSPSP